VKDPPAFFKGKGCDACCRTGFDRETTIFEALAMTDELRFALEKGMKIEAVRQLLRQGGMLTLRQIAIHKAINGQTSLSEVLRVTV
jgi:type II secretory ATPase GspE/PulE/Tfp pilus assembly ATPase PilB-like protein